MSQEKYDEDNENSSEKINNNNTETTIVSTGGGNSAQQQQIFHVSVEYEEAKPKTKGELIESGRKRRLVKDKGIEITQSSMMNQYVHQLQPSAPKQTPTIIIDDKSQDHEIKNLASEGDEPPSKVAKHEDRKKDKFDIFGMFVASEMRNLKKQSLQRKLKRKILECVLEMEDEDSDNHA